MVHSNTIRQPADKLQKSTSNPSQQTSLMAKLLATQKSSLRVLHKGDLIKGTITKLTPKEILVDIQAKTEAVVLEKDKKILRSLLDALKVGDEVEISVLNPESDLGHPVVSLRRFMEHRVWNKLSDYQKKKQTIQATVREITRGGYLLETLEGVVGFLPNSQISYSKFSKASLENVPGQRDQDILGRSLDVFILELNRIGKKIIFSQKPVIGIEEFEQRIGEVKTGQKTTAIVTNITAFGLFVTLPEFDNLDGLIHISEIAWDKVENIGGMFSSGENVEVVVIGIDKEAKRAELSIRKLTTDPFEEIIRNVAIDQKLEGTVTKVFSSGIYLEFKADTLKSAEGFIRKEKIPPNTNYELGQTVSATVSEIDRKRHRIMLTPVLTEKPIGYR